MQRNGDTIDIARRQITTAKGLRRLSPLECNYLTLLIQRGFGAVFISEFATQRSLTGSSAHAVYQAVHQLRCKLDDIDMPVSISSAGVERYRLVDRSGKPWSQARPWPFSQDVTIAAIEASIRASSMVVTALASPPRDSALAFRTAQLQLCPS